jgi:hypothetical protein
LELGAFFFGLAEKKPGFPLQSFLPPCGKKGFPLQSHRAACGVYAVKITAALPPVIARGLCALHFIAGGSPEAMQPASFAHPLAE